MTKYFTGIILLCLIIGGLILPHDRPALVTYTYGVHYPNGNAAVNYIYGPDGMWKSLDRIEYTSNYYLQNATPGHPFNRSELITYANGSHLTTAPDINNHLLFDLNHRGNPFIPEEGEVAAFFEHNGRGVNNLVKATPFTNFWFDDNWLARYMSDAYGRLEPYGLSQYHDFTRWQILSGDISNWSPYTDDHIDTLALDGLYYLASGEFTLAYNNWQRILSKSGYFYNETDQRYQYPGIRENYHLGLFKILTDKLLNAPATQAALQNQLLQHSISLRSNILSNQERQGSSLYGWVSAMGDTKSLMNTETLAVDVLALGAGAKYTYEAGQPPLIAPGNYFLRSYNVLSAVTGLSLPGYMSNGPDLNLPAGTYSVDFMVRIPELTGNPVARLEVYDATSERMLAQQEIAGNDLASADQWNRLSLKVSLAKPDDWLQFRLYWYGNTNLDLAFVQVR